MTVKTIKHREELLNDWDVNSLYPDPPISVTYIDEVHFNMPPDRSKDYVKMLAMPNGPEKTAWKIALSSAYGHIATRYRFTGKLSRKKAPTRCTKETSDHPQQSIA
jgi:hypothetical protein